MIIAIDGPAGSGKSTLAKDLSQVLKFPYLNTGLCYRAFALVAIYEDVKDLIELFSKDIKISPEISKTLVFYKSEDISERLQSEEIGKKASEIATNPAFREKINELFRSIATQNLIAEGRDAGTNIFPKAEVKIFLEASAQERARRRYNQLKEQGQEVDFEEILKAIIDRDTRDQNRPVYPFRKAEDAIVINTTGLSKEEVLKKALEIIKPRF
ncbi:MAG: (d)CMP kinase [Aquificaceae bacterium]|nr:(d)CMP kinase [Aquificaceae bacterium]MDW8236825.1 (d)CMP kinase [Aquificaceae bacterium]